MNIKSKKLKPWYKRLVMHLTNHVYYMGNKTSSWILEHLYYYSDYQFYDIEYEPDNRLVNVKYMLIKDNLIAERPNTLGALQGIADD